jgi:GGDEF domain-containing protein
VVREHQAKLIEAFNDWFERQDAGESLWPAFDRWVRDALNEFLGARRVRCFHAADDARHLVSLTTQLEEPLWPPAGLPGLIVHVLATGRAYTPGSRLGGESIERLVTEWATAVAQTPGLKSAVPHVLLPICSAGRTLGLVLVGEVPEDIRRDESALATLDALLTVFWRQVRQAQALALAECTDRSSGVLTWADLSARAERVLGESRREDEPVVVLALAVEGIRRLDDSGHWTLRDALMGQIGGQMRAKLRSDDLVGRFSQDRFVAVLRRLDLVLGQVIASKLLATVQGILDGQPVLKDMVRIRCGLSDSGVNNFELALGRAFEGLHLARRRNLEAPLVVARRQAEETPAANRV